MRSLVLSLAVSLLSLACLGSAHAQALTWEHPISANTSNIISQIVRLDAMQDLERIASSIPQSQRDMARREILHRIVSESFDRNNWSNSGFLIYAIKMAQVSSFLAPTPSRLQSLTVADMDEANDLRNLIGYPGQQHGSLLLWARQFDLNAITPTMRDAQYAVSLVRDESAPAQVIVLERLIGTQYAGLLEVFTVAPPDLVTISKLRLDDARVGSTTRISLGEFFIAVAIAKMSALLPSLPPNEQPLLEIAILNGVEGTTWLGASWATLAYRSRLSSFLRRIDSNDSIFTEADKARLRYRLVAGSFFARAFETVAAMYLATANRPEATAADKVYGYHGAGISFIGLGDEGKGFEHLRKAARSVDWERNLPYAFSLVSIDRATTKNFLAAKGDAPAPAIEQGMLRAFGAILNLYSTEEGRQLYENMNEDFLRVMHTITRPDIAIRHGIEQMAILDNNWPDEDRDRLQSFFIGEICAFLTDLFYEISFEWRSGKWERRKGQQDAFLPTMRQLRLPSRYDDLYSKSHPEEDRAVTLENAILSRAVAICKNTNDQAVCAEAATGIPTGFISIEDWVGHHQGANFQVSRAYLKAIWSYWFALPLEGKKPREDKSFIYFPADIFPTLSLESARNLLNDIGKGEVSREWEILKLMIEIREFLQTRFPPTNR